MKHAICTYLCPEIRRVELQCHGPDEGEGCGGAEFSKHVDSHKCCMVCLGKEGEGEAAERLASSKGPAAIGTIGTSASEPS